MYRLLVASIVLFLVSVTSGAEPAGRPPEDVARELLQVYGKKLPAVTYIPALALHCRWQFGELTGDVTQRTTVQALLPDPAPVPKSQVEYAGQLVYAAVARDSDTAHRDKSVAAVRQAADQLMVAPDRTAVRPPGENEMSDAVFMCGPILSEAGALSGEARYFDAAVQYLSGLRRLRMREDGLYRHGHLCDAAWGRGNGFPAVGAAWSLTRLPESHPGRRELLASFRRHMQTLVKFQTADGLWRQVIDVPTAYEEFSATAMIGFAMQRGVTAGWLDSATFQPVVDRAWNAICKRIEPGGKIIDVCEGTGTQKSLEDYLMRKAIRGVDDRGGAMALLFAIERLSADKQRAVPAPAPAISGVNFEPAIRAGQMRPHVEFLASPRLAGRSGEAKAEARRYIVEQWKSIGLRPVFASPTNASTTADAANEFEQPIPGNAADDGTVPILGHNLGAWLPGSDPERSDEIVIISAHYDHLGVRDGEIYAGADDNASGVAMLIESARHIATSKQAPARSIVFIAFDLEENLLWGSRWFAAHPPWPLARVKLFVTADMIGRSLGDLPFPAVFVFGSERSSQLRTALDVVGTPPGLEVCRLGTDIVGTRSDYGAFRDREIPFLFFSTGEHPDYHSPQDTPDKIDYDKAARIASLMLNISCQIANSPETPVWNNPPEHSMEEPRVLNRIASLLLEADEKKPLTSTQRFVVTNVRNRSRRILEANVMSADDRAWLVRMSQVLLLSVF